MTKKKSKTKKISKEDLNETFDYWNDALDSMKEQAEKSYMFLLVGLFEYAKSIVEMYRKTYLIMYDKKDKEE